MAQNKTGLLVSAEKYQRVPQLEVTGEKFNSLPLRVSLKKYCPVVGNQRSVGACVGWSTGYGAMTIMLVQKLGLTDKAEITEKALSAAFIYNQIKVKADSCSDGAYLEDAFDLLKSKGDCLEKNFNYEQNDCKALPKSSLIQEAANYKVKDYAAVFQVGEESESKTAKACKILSKETPIVIGMGITPSFWHIKSGTKLWDPESTEEVSGNHAMLVVGYDNVEKQFELMNSFGPAWGHNGFIKIKFDDFERLCKYAFILVLDDNKIANKDAQQENSSQPKLNTKQLSGAFVFRKPAGYLTNAEGEDVPYFEEVTMQYNSKINCYEPLQKNFSVGDAFQLVARQIPRGQYAYVFSQSPNGTVNLHFPKKNIANFALDKDSEIIIPNEESVLQIPEAGEDYLCIVYSDSEIKNFDARFEQLKTGNDFSQKVKKTFGDLLMPNNLVQFQEQKMSFSAALPSNKSAVALILKVTTNPK